MVRGSCLVVLALMLNPGNTIAGDLLVDVVVPIDAASAVAGQTEITGIGEVTFVAEARGNRLVIRALNPQRIVIGRAEVTRGLQEAPLYVNTPDGLQKIILQLVTD
jgi:hypothetical protein